MRLGLVAFALALASSQPAYGWGDAGHRITGYVANTLLSEPARRQLRNMIGTDDLSQVATWMDDERPELEQRWHGSSRWHYENREACAKANNSSHTCPHGDCITEQIEHHIGVLRNRQASRAQRADAARILVHLLGDLHQPLHLIDNNDRGGNDVWVFMPREPEPRRLHEVWDTRFIHLDLHRRSEAHYAQSLLREFVHEQRAWQSGDVEQWARESYTLGLRQAYQALPGFACRTEHPLGAISLNAAYISTATATVESQLVKAGVRIARVLNETLTDQ